MNDNHRQDLRKKNTNFNMQMSTEFPQKQEAHRIHLFFLLAHVQFENVKRHNFVLSVAIAKSDKSILNNSALLRDLP